MTEVPSFDDLLDFSGKTVVSRARHGIGRAVCEAFARRRRRRASGVADAAVSNVAVSLGTATYAHLADVTDEPEVDARVKS